MSSVRRFIEKKYPNITPKQRDTLAGMFTEIYGTDLSDESVELSGDYYFDRVVTADPRLAMPAPTDLQLVDVELARRRALNLRVDAAARIEIARDLKSLTPDQRLARMPIDTNTPALPPAVPDKNAPGSETQSGNISTEELDALIFERTGVPANQMLVARREANRNALRAIENPKKLPTPLADAIAAGAKDLSTMSPMERIMWARQNQAAAARKP